MCDHSNESSQWVLSNGGIHVVDEQGFMFSQILCLIWTEKHGSERVKKYNSNAPAPGRYTDTQKVDKVVPGIVTNESPMWLKILKASKLVTSRQSAFLPRRFHTIIEKNVEKNLFRWG